MNKLGPRLVGRVLPMLPEAWRLPLFAHTMSGVEAESRCLEKIGPLRGIAVDIGANFGLYSWALSKLYRQVVAFEPNEEASALLRQWRSPKVRLVPIGLSNASGNAKFFIPVARGLRLDGWASLDAQNCREAEEVIEKNIPLRTLDSFDLEDVGFIKIDVEGHEREVLAGGAKTICAHRPHLLIELRRNADEITELLAGWGYRRTTLREIVGFEGGEDNFIFLPN